MRVPKGYINVLLTEIGGVEGIAGIHRQGGSEPPVQARKRALAEAGQNIQVNLAPIVKFGDIDHRLAQVVLAVQVFDQVDLVDDVDQMVRFRHPPEHLVEAGQDFPAVGLIEPIGLADIKVGALAIAGIQTQIRNKTELVLAAFGPVAELRLDNQGYFGIPLLAR